VPARQVPARRVQARHVPARQVRVPEHPLPVRADARCSAAWFTAVVSEVLGVFATGHLGELPDLTVIGGVKTG
jgi:hypothetical protein